METRFFLFCFSWFPSDSFPNPVGFYQAGFQVSWSFQTPINLCCYVSFNSGLGCSSPVRRKPTKEMRLSKVLAGNLLKKRRRRKKKRFPREGTNILSYFDYYKQNLWWPPSVWSKGWQQRWTPTQWLWQAEPCWAALRAASRSVQHTDRN